MRGGSTKKRDWWFALANSVKDHPKVLLLPNDTLRWQWIVMLCVASMYDGAIPSLDVAALALRLPTNKAAQVIAALYRANLLDDDTANGGYFLAHDWDDHRPRRNKGESTQAERKANQRAREKERRIRECHGDVTAKNAVTCHGDVTALQLHQQKTDDEDEAREPIISDEAIKLADEIAIIAGHSLDFVPPSWYGAPYRVQKWLDQDWPDALIISSVREQVGRRRGRQPISSIQYFEKGIAEHIAQQRAPLPKVVEVPAKTVEVTKNDKHSGLAAIDRVFAKLKDQPGPAAIADENAVQLLPPRSVSGP